MAYSIHIERLDPTGKRVPIREDEWTNAVASNDGVRLLIGDAAALNPATGESISIKNSGFDVELFSEELQAWVPGFFWSERGKASFKATNDFENPRSSLRVAATNLARTLNAALVGDEGETYT